MESAIIREKGIRQAAEETAKQATANEGEGVYSGIEAEMPAETEQQVSQEVETETPVEQAVEQGVTAAEQGVTETETETVSPTVTSRSAEELAQIDALQAQANQARDFNSLPERQQKELIEIEAKSIVAQEKGDTTAYENYVKEYNEKFNDYVARDKELDHDAARANIKGTHENDARQYIKDAIEGKNRFDFGKDWTDEQRAEKLAEYHENFGYDTGKVVNGVQQFKRFGGSLKKEVPGEQPNPFHNAQNELESAIIRERNTWDQNHKEVVTESTVSQEKSSPETQSRYVPKFKPVQEGNASFKKLGYEKQEDGTYLYEDDWRRIVVDDKNHNDKPEFYNELVDWIEKRDDGFKVYNFSTSDESASTTQSEVKTPEPELGR